MRPASGPRDALVALPNGLVLDRLFAGAPVGLAIFDRDLRFVRVNPALARMHRVPVDAHAGARASDVLGAAGGHLEAVLAQVLETGAPVLGVEYAHPERG